MADQATGLRRRSEQLPLHCLHCYFDMAGTSTQLARALHRLGQVSLLIDLSGRVFANASTRGLFDPGKQLERGAPCTLPQAYGDGWYAPGLPADAPNLRTLAQGYDCVVFDTGPVRTGPDRMPGARHDVIIEVQPAHESMLRAYALLKTLSHADNTPGIALLGDTSACNHVRAACSHFLAPSFTHAIDSVAHEDDAIAALAIRIAGKRSGEQHATARTITGTNLNHGR